MMHPLVHLVATQPQLLAEHAEAYGELLVAEMSNAAGVLKRQIALLAAALFSLSVAAVLAGVAVMLRALDATAAAGSALPWSLIATPALPLVIGLGCLIAARQGRSDKPFVPFGRQVKADLDMLRAAIAA